MKGFVPKGQVWLPSHQYLPEVESLTGVQRGGILILTMSHFLHSLYLNIYVRYKE